MAAFTNFVVKVHELCNINCSYCYMYNLRDQSFRGRPKKMSRATRGAFFGRLARHVERFELADIVVFLHGGEPLLCGKAYIEDWINALRRAMPSTCNVIVIAQTNGMLLDDDWIELLHRHRVRIGISLDGPRAFHDRFRLTKRGSGTYDVVMDKLALLRRHPLGEEVFGSILSVANPEIPPRDLWETWLGTGFRRFDFNLPHCSHDDPPWFSQDRLTAWLKELFDLWWTADAPEIDIRFFRNIVHLLLGATSATDYIGGTEVGILVVETDGALTGTDALRACADGLIDVGMSVFTNEIQDPMDVPLVRDCNHGAAVLSKTCRGCEVREVCGGGYFPHRYRGANGFDNPSVYCSSLYALINHIRQAMVESAPGLFPEAADRVAA
jgi:uncharacterized protein